MEEMLMKQLYAVVLAAGEGKRMHSRMPKVLHSLCGKPMLGYIMESAAELTKRILVVVGHGASQVQAAMSDKWHYVLQKEQLGTGHAVMQALKELPQEGTLLVLCGDTPLLESGYLRHLLDHQEQRAAVVLTAILPDPEGYGRIIRTPGGLVERIVEEKDASEEEKRICEINTGTYSFNLKLLRDYLPALTTDNVQNEYYLTDVIALMGKEGHKVGACLIEDYRVGLGINDRLQLAEAEALIRKRINTRLMLKGVTLVDPDSVYIDYDVQVGTDTVIKPNCVIEKGSVIGSECSVGPAVHISRSVLKDGVVLEHSVVDDSVIESGVRLDAFTVVRSKKVN
jgi:bifunctional UDP-N-acetylglucosamine pyrophosphorylase / glucosamine-1-phosphate N-acetyltransferase